MSERIKIQLIRLTHDVLVESDGTTQRVPYYYEAETGELAIALELIRPGEDEFFQINPPQSDDHDEEGIIDQLVGVFCAVPKMKDVVAHKLLCGSCPCTPLGGCLADPTGSHWRGLCKKARARIKESSCAPHRRQNKILLVKSARTLLGCVPKWLLPKSKTTTEDSGRI